MGVEIYNEMPLEAVRNARDAALLANTASLGELQTLKADVELVKMLLLQQIAPPDDMPEMPPMPEGEELPPMPPMP